MLSSAAGAAGADPGRAAPPDARRPLALEPQPRPRAAAHERGQAPPHPPPAHGGRRPAGRGVARAWPPARRTRPPGPVGVPDHVLARQTVDDCLHEGLSVEGLVDVWARVESGAIAVHTVESSEPSPFSHAILSGRPYTYLDDAPLEERRTRALSLRRGLGQLGPDGLPVPADELAALDPDAVAAVLEQVCPQPRDADELHDLLLSLVAARPVRDWADWFDALAADGRAGLVDGCWVATERAAAAAALGHRRRRGRRLRRRPPPAGRSGHGRGAGGRRAAARRRAAGRAAHRGPGPHRAGPARGTRARPSSCPTAAGAPATCWCACTGPAGAGGAAWSTPCRSPTTCASSPTGSTPRPTAGWRAGPGCSRCSSSCRGSRRRRPSGRPRSSPPGSTGYDPRWLDELCLSGEVVWGRLTPRAERTGRSGTPSPATPLAFVVRDDLVTMLRAVRAGAAGARARGRRRRPTCSPRCAPAAPASVPSWRR